MNFRTIDVETSDGVVERWQVSRFDGEAFACTRWVFRQGGFDVFCASIGEAAGRYKRNDDEGGLAAANNAHAAIESVTGDEFVDSQHAIRFFVAERHSNSLRRQAHDLVSAVDPTLGNFDARA